MSNGIGGKHHPKNDPASKPVEEKAGTGRETEFAPDRTNPRSLIDGD